MEATFWSIVPAIVAIVLALLTKEVYFSLLIGILSGAMLYTMGNPVTAVVTTFEVMADSVGGNANILIFLVLLGILVSLVTKSGASAAYGSWASRAITTKRGALAATAGLGTLIFVDDYFNCLTVGTVMRPLTDRLGVTRAKLAYIIDATAAPICIIAPISSWAAAVGSSLPEDSGLDGFTTFLKTIPFNLYALLSIVMVVSLVVFNVDFWSMRKYEKEHAEDKLETKAVEVVGKGKVLDLVLPIVMLIVFCVVAMLYTGGLFDGANIIDAFANCASSQSLVIGSFAAVVFTFLLYIPRKVLSFTDFASSFVDGFKAMVPALLILTLAWTLSGIVGADCLNAGGFVKTVVDAESMGMWMPAVFFLVALGLAFATGTSWGTFGILIPIATAVFGSTGPEMLIITISAILAGAVCGDHVSPISDTTILSSAGADCNHIDHVSTQLPYALFVAGISFVGYIISGLTGSWVIPLVVGAALIVGFVYFMKVLQKKKENA